MTLVAPAAGLVLLVQEGYFRVEDAAVLAALPEALRSCPRERFVIDLMGRPSRLSPHPIGTRPPASWSMPTATR